MRAAFEECTVVCLATDASSVGRQETVAGVILAQAGPGAPWMAAWTPPQAGAPGGNGFLRFPPFSSGLAAVASGRAFFAPENLREDFFQTVSSGRSFFLADATLCEESRPPPPEEERGQPP
eukprot:936233-Lingulodinium_polyedra.AAC.1